MGEKQYAIGIDLGTTYSCVGYWKNDRVEIIANSQGNRTTPSFVAFNDDEGRLIGEAAYNQCAINTTNTIFDSKRLIGRRFSEETVQRDIETWPFKVTADSDGKPMISVTCNANGETKKFSPEQISAMILDLLRKMAEDSIGSKVKDAVITVPAYFDQSQRQATIDAGKIAEINVLRLINEPTAAAIAYFLDQNISTITGKKNVLVFDLGGGTFDVSCLTITKNKIEVKAVGGDSHLGGQDFDNRVVDHFIEVFKSKYKKDISGSAKARRRLKTACERGKRALSTGANTTIIVDALYEGEDFSEKLTRLKFEELNSDLLKKCIDGVEKCLIDAKMDKKDVDEVVLVGGSSRIVKVQEMLSELMNGKKLNKSLNPDEAIASGAAVQAALLSGQGSKKIENLVLLDVTPLTLGVQVQGDVMSVFIPKNTPIPTRVVRSMTTSFDYQTSIKFQVFEGERARSKDNKLLGVMTLTGIKPAPRREASVDVSFDLQADGILDVSAKDRYTGSEVRTTIKDMKLSGEEIQRMIKEANEFKAGDEEYVKKGEARYAFETYICGLRNELKVKSNNMKADEKKKAENAVEEAFKWLDSRDQLAELSEYEEKKKYLMSVMDVARKSGN